MMRGKFCRLSPGLGWLALIVIGWAAGPAAAQASLLGDCNCDGQVNAFDIEAFVLAVTDPAGYQQQYPNCSILRADCNQDGLVNAFDIEPFVAILVGGPPIEAELAGNPLAGYPHFEYVKAFNRNAPVHLAVDPARYPQVVGRPANIYVVAGKTAAQWAADPTLADVRVAGPQPVVFVGGTIQANTFQITAANELSADAGLGLGVPYDVVVDLNRNGRLDTGDLIDGRGDEGGMYVVHDTTAPGPLAVTEIIYSGGSWLGQDTYYPTNISSLPPRPLIVISHGNGHNYQWYDYIGYHLASYGYVVMSHENNTAPGIETASTTTLTNTDYFLGNLATIGGGVLNGRVDARRIVWIGHSRGGEGITRAYDRIRDEGYTPVNFSLSDIVLMDSMLPVDFLKNARSNPHGCNYHLWTASGDNDVHGGASCDLCQTFHLHDRATGTRLSSVLQGAGHGDFHSGSGGDVFTGPCKITPRSNIHLVIKGYMLPLMKHFTEGNDAATDFFWRQWERFKPMGAPSIPGCPQSGGGDYVVLSNTYRNRRPGTFWVIDDYQTQSALDVSSSGGPVTYTVMNVYEGRLDDANTAFTWTTADPMNGSTNASSEGTPQDDSRGVTFDWTEFNLYYEFGIVPGGRDFTPYRYLSFRAAQATRHPNTIAALGDLTFTVTLRDAAGASSSINFGVYGGGLEEPYQRTGEGTGTGWHNEMETIRIRLTDFLHNGTGLDLANIVAVRLNFGPAFGSPVGRIVLDEVELTKE